MSKQAPSGSILGIPNPGKNQAPLAVDRMLAKLAAVAQSGLERYARDPRLSHEFIYTFTDTFATALMVAVLHSYAANARAKATTSSSNATD